MSKYAISGMNGFIGQALKKRLEKDHEVIGIPRHLLSMGLSRFFRSFQPDYIIHLSAYGNHYNQKDRDQILHTNVVETFKLLQAASGYKKLYNISSSSVCLKTKTFYSVTKLCAEKLCELYEGVVNVRPYSVYGPGEAAHRFIPTVIRALKNGEEITLDEEATHDWIYIDCFIEALLKDYLFIGTGKKTTNLEVVQLLQTISGKSLRYIPGKLRVYDNEDWVCKAPVPHISLFEGLRQTYAAYS